MLILLRFRSTRPLTPLENVKFFGLSLMNVKLSDHRYQVLYYHSRIQHYHNPQAF